MLSNDCCDATPSIMEAQIQFPDRVTGVRGVRTIAE
jgi:hypothetical protein